MLPQEVEWWYCGIKMTMVVIAIDSVGSQELDLAISIPICPSPVRPVDEKEDEMTVRLPSRIKEGNKRCRGRYIGTTHHTGGGAWVSLPYQPRLLRTCLLPQPAQPSPASPIPNQPDPTHCRPAQCSTLLWHAARSSVVPGCWGSCLAQF